MTHTEKHLQHLMKPLLFKGKIRTKLVTSVLVICCIRLWLIAWFYLLLQHICGSFRCLMLLRLQEVSVLSVFVSSALKYVRKKQAGPSCMCQCACACTLSLARCPWFLHCHACMPSIICLNCWLSFSPVICYWEEIASDMLSWQARVTKCSCGAFKCIFTKQQDDLVRTAVTQNPDSRWNLNFATGRLKYNA